MRYPYHNRIKQRIKAGELIGYEFVDDYPGIGEALVLKFITEPFIRPIRPHKYITYIDVLRLWEKGAFNKVEEADLERLKQLLNINFVGESQIELTYESPSKS